MIRALYHAFKLYIKIHGETFCCLTFLGEKNFDQHFPDLGRLEATLQKRIALVLIVMQINDLYDVVSTSLETLQQWQGVQCAVFYRLTAISLL
jgi:hypothetical protein